MIEWFSSFSAVEQVFLAMALIGGSIFVIQLVMMLLGGDTGSDGTVAGVDFSSTDFLFKYFSLQSLTAFFMVAGLTGLYACSQGANIWVAIIVAIISGAIIAWALVRFSEMLLKLQSSGNLSLKNAIGQAGSVYQLIPADGEGKVEINLQGRRLYPKAISKNKEEIKCGVRISVVDISGDDTLVVTREQN